MLIKKVDLFSYFQAIQWAENLQWVRFLIAKEKNKRKIKEAAEPIEKWGEVFEWFKVYEKERVELCEKHSNKDENWKAIIVWEEKNAQWAVIKPWTYSITNILEFEKELTELREKHSTAITEREKQLEDYNKILMEEMEIDFEKIKSEDIPSNITPKQFSEILFMIEL